MGEVRLEELYSEYKTKVFGYFISHLKDPIEAEDLTGDVFVKAFKALNRFDPDKASVSTWIYTITRNVLIDYLRKKKELSELPEELVSMENIEEQTIQEEELVHLVNALKELDKEQREIIVMHYYLNKPLTEIALSMNLSYGAVKLRHRKALETLKKKIGK